MRLVIPKDLYQILLKEANAANMSMARYILSLLYNHVEK